MILWQFFPSRGNRDNRGWSGRGHCQNCDANKGAAGWTKGRRHQWGPESWHRAGQVRPRAGWDGMPGVPLIVPSVSQRTRPPHAIDTDTGKEEPAVAQLTIWISPCHLTYQYSSPLSASANTSLTDRPTSINSRNPSRHLRPRTYLTTPTRSLPSIVAKPTQSLPVISHLVLPPRRLTSSPPPLHILQR